MHFLTHEDEQNPDHNLQTDGDAYEGDDGEVEGELWSLNQRCLQLGGVGHQKGHVQHALSGALLVDVVVDIQRGSIVVGHAGCTRSLETRT